ncbi:MAG: lysylphosphatidylglycerol synthase transmembrane domain-containing protein [Candidatus Latescibacterota bacterium]
MGRWLSYILPFVGLAIFIFIISGTGVGNILDTFRQVNPFHLILFPFVIIAILLIRGFRWQMLMRMVGIPYTMWRSTSVWAIGFFAAAITPGKVGDAIRALYVSQDTGKNFGECFLTVFIDRLMDLITIVLFGMITTVLFSYHYIKIPSLWLVFIGIFAFFVLLFAVMSRSLMRKLIKPIFNLLAPKKFKDSMSLGFNSFYDSLGIYLTKWQGTLGVLILTFIYWVMVFGLAWYVAFTLNIDVTFGYLFIIMPMVTLVELIPISISGLGTREAAVIYFFSVVGISSAYAVSFSITYLIMGTYLTSILGFIFWLRNPVKLRA